jgi:hypothetical protein
MTHPSKAHGRRRRVSTTCKYVLISTDRRDLDAAMSLFISSASLFAPKSKATLPISPPPTACPTPPSEGIPCNNAWRCIMKFFSRLFAARGNTNLTTALERQRLSNTMPGQTAAMAASRLGVIVI